MLSEIGDLGEPLHVCEDPKKQEFFVKGIKELIVETFEDCMEILKLGEYNRHYAATSMNH